MTNPSPWISHPLPLPSVQVYGYTVSQSEHCLVATESHFPGIQAALFHVQSLVPSPHPSAPVARGLPFGLAHSSAIASLFIHWPLSCLSKTQLFFLLWSQRALLVCCTNVLSLGSAILSEKLTEWRLIKFENTQKINSWTWGDIFLYCLSLYPVSVEDRTFVTFLILFYQLVILACCFTSLHLPVSFLTLCGVSFCFIEGLLRAPGSLLGLGCGSVKPDWQQAVITEPCFSSRYYFLSSQKWLFPGMFSGMACGMVC